MGSCNNKDAKQTLVTFHHQVVSQLVQPRPESECPLKLAYHFANIVREFTGDEVVETTKAFNWPENMKTKNTTTISTRRTRLLDRLVRYGEEYQYSHADIYNCFFMVCPHVERIVELNKSQFWESHNDWYVYDMFAKLVLLCVPGKDLKTLQERAQQLVREIDETYNPQDARKVKEICKFLELELRKTHLKSGKQTFGEWTTQCVQHFCDIALNETKSDASVAKRVTETAHLILHFSFMHPKLWFKTPFQLVSAAVNSSVTFHGKGTWGNWYQVQYRTAVRSGILLDSATKGLCNPGDLVHIVQSFGRRVQVDAPFRGFCSLHDGAGLQILKPVTGEDLLTTLTGCSHKSLQSPFRDMTRWIFTDRTTTYVSLKNKFAEDKYCQVGTFTFSDGQLVQADETMNE